MAPASRPWPKTRRPSVCLRARTGANVEIINPDIVTSDLRLRYPSLSLGNANSTAARYCERRVDHLIGQATHSFAIETVLSTDKYKQRVTLARQKGFYVYFIYIVLDSVEHAIERVKLRVSRGGHDVPEQKIRKRWPLSLGNVDWFWRNATDALVIYNDERYLKLAQRQGEQMTLAMDPPKSTQALLTRLLPAWTFEKPIVDDHYTRRPT